MMSTSEVDAVERAPATVRFAPGGPRIFRRDEASSYAWWGNLAVVLGRQPPDASHIGNYRACLVELAKQHPQGIGVITIVNATSTPTPSGREALIGMMKELWPQFDAMLFIPNADGFKAAVLRSVMGCIILASGRRDRVRVERTVSTGVPWLAAKLGVGDRRTMALLEQGIQRFCDVENVWLNPS